MESNNYNYGFTNKDGETGELKLDQEALRMAQKKEDEVLKALGVLLSVDSVAHETGRIAVDQEKLDQVFTALQNGHERGFQAGDSFVSGFLLPFELIDWMTRSSQKDHGSRLFAEANSAGIAIQSFKKFDINIDQSTEIVDIDGYSRSKTTTLYMTAFFDKNFVIQAGTFSNNAVVVFDQKTGLIGKHANGKTEIIGLCDRSKLREDLVINGFLMCKDSGLKPQVCLSQAQKTMYFSREAVFRFQIPQKNNDSQCTIL